MGTPEECRYHLEQKVWFHNAHAQKDVIVERGAVENIPNRQVYEIRISMYEAKEQQHEKEETRDLNPSMALEWPLSVSGIVNRREGMPAVRWSQ